MKLLIITLFAVFSLSNFAAPNFITDTKNFFNIRTVEHDPASRIGEWAEFSFEKLYDDGTKKKGDNFPSNSRL